MEFYNIELMGSDNNSYRLSDFEGKWIVLFFYPKDDTSGCTIENKEFSDLKQQFLDHNAYIIGVSRDSLKKHQNFCKKHNLEHLLLVDENSLLCNEFDVIKEKSMYGKKYMGIVRSTYIIDPDLKVVKSFEKVSPNGHAQMILDELIELQQKKEVE